MNMSSNCERDLVTDTNLSHTMSLDNFELSADVFKNLLSENVCPCTLREIIFHSQLNVIDITTFSIEIQLGILTQLASEPFNSKCFTDANHTICINSFLSPGSDICISQCCRWSAEQEEVMRSEFRAKTSDIPVDSKLHLACLLKDHHYVQKMIEHSADLETKKTLFFGVSCGEIVDALMKHEVPIGTVDARGRTPLFYALTSSLDSTKKLLDRAPVKGIYRVSLVTIFAENILKNRVSVEIRDEIITLLLSKRVISQEKMAKIVINFAFCKFIQVLGSVAFDPNMLSETLLCIFGQNVNDADDKRNALINHLQSMQRGMDAGNFDMSNATLEIFRKFCDLGAKPTSPDSDGNTCLHYATRLLFYDVPRETVTQLCRKLIELDAKLDAKNHKNETPLLFFLSSRDLVAANTTRDWSGSMQAVCTVLLENGSEMRQTTHKEESAFQLVLKICQYAILLPDKDQKRRIFDEMFRILETFSSRIIQAKVAVNKRDIHLNSPLHLWASLALKSSGQYVANVFADLSFKDLLKKILDLLLKCGVQVNDSNAKAETPLHVCRTWTAVKLLLEAGANPKVVDSSKCTPLSAAAMKNTCLKQGSDRFYPDVTQDTNTFWKEVLNHHLDPWTADCSGESVMSTLIKKEATSLAKAMVDVACEQKHVDSDEIGGSLLTTICRDASTDKEWKFDLVKKLLDTRRDLVNKTPRGSKDTALHLSCSNAINLPKASVKTSVHWKIIKHLLLCGADVKAPGENGKFCLDLSDECEVLKSLLSSPVNYRKLPLVLENWKQSSVIHAKQLSLVARKVEFRQANTLYFYKDPLDKDKSSCGFVFAGINSENGKEVAVKRIDKLKMPELESVLVTTQRCEKMVEYLFCKPDIDEKFHHLAFELMEGDLDDYLDRTKGMRTDSIKLCKDVISGLKFLHSLGIHHGNINPRTVFYQKRINVFCFKIGNCKTSSPRRCWAASEVLRSPAVRFRGSDQSDMFSCGLVFHYLLSARKHPFATDNCLDEETEANILNGNIVEIDDSLAPESNNLVQLMLNSEATNRPSAKKALVHPYFWNIETKKKFLNVVGNEPEAARQGNRHPLTAFEFEIEERFNTIVTRSGQWNDSPQYDKISATYAGMNPRFRPNYNYSTVAGLIRFIRNAYVHMNEQPAHIQSMWENDFVLIDYFPRLVIEVYKALTTSEFHDLHKSRRGIKKFFSELE